MLVKMATTAPLVEVGKASLPQKEVLAQKENEDKVVHVSRPFVPMTRLQQPIRIVEK